MHMPIERYAIYNQKLFWSLSGFQLKKRIRFYLYNQIRSVRLDPYRITEIALFKKLRALFLFSVKEYSDRNRWIALDRLPKFCIKYLKQHEHKHIM